MIIVSDTTPISELAKVNYLNLLPKLFGRVVIPQGVYDELTKGRHTHEFNALSPRYTGNK